MSKVLLYVIATGEKYWPYIAPLLDSARKYFLPHDSILFTDSSGHYGQSYTAPITAKGYPRETLWRYHTLLSMTDRIHGRYDFIFYCDVDMLFVDHVGEEILADGITATLHAGYIHPSKNNNFTNGTWEERVESTAYVRHGMGRQYFAGGFNGGSCETYLAMASLISHNIDVDQVRGIVALWHDESHFNRYLYDHPPARVLSPAYCYPEPLHFTNPDPDKVRRGIEMMREAGLTEHDIWQGEVYVPKLLALEKRWRS